MNKINVSLLGLEVTRFCTLECLHCLRGDYKKEYISDEVIEKSFEYIKHIDKLLITGGEPFVAIKALRKIIDMLKISDISVGKITIVTNATVLYDKQIELLDELRLLCKELEILISFSKFHLMELENKGHLETEKRNTEILKNRYNASLYGYPFDTAYKVIIYSVGRAAKLTQEYLDKINSIGEPSNYVLWNNRLNNCYYECDEYLSGNIYVSVNGTLVTNGLPFDEEDEQDEKYNILNTGLLEAINNRINEEVVLKNKL